MVKTKEQHFQDIDLFLRKIHIFGMDPAERRRLSKNLAEFGLTAGKVGVAWGEARACSSDDGYARGLFAKTISSPSMVYDIAADVEDRIAKCKGSDATAPALAHVSDSNPFGWESPNPMRISDPREQNQAGDHGRPGEWNGFRQSYNMTEKERIEAKAHDCRRAGCSRIEMLGEFDKDRVKDGKDLAPDPFYDNEGVERLRGLSAGKDVVERKVYGE